MEHKAKSIRPFIGAKDYEQSRSFYRNLNFKETVLSFNMSYFEADGLGFYLQDYYTKDWIENTMVFMEVDNVNRYYNELLLLDLPCKYAGVKLTPIRLQPWGKECYLHDPSGILWHFGEFNTL